MLSTTPRRLGPPLLPEPRSPLSDAVINLRRADGPTALPVFEDADPYGGDLQLALYCCYELHYGGFAKILEALTVHTYIENEGMYPAVRELLPPDLDDDVPESYEEHHVADVLCMELAAMSAEDERFDAKTTVLIENVTHHVEEEEQEWFPEVREGLGRRSASRCWN